MQDRFFFWHGYYEAISMLPTNEQRGEFISGMCACAFDGIEPTFTDPMQKIVWAAIKDQVCESVEIGRKQSEYGKRGGRPKKSQPEKQPKRDPKRVPKRQPESQPERVPESVRYGTVPSASRTSAGADALALDESEQWYVDNGLEVPFVPDESGGE